MRAPRGWIHTLLVLALLWQSVTGGLAVGRMAALDMAFAGAACRIGGGADAPDVGDASPEHDSLCALRCAAAVVGPPPGPPATIARPAFAGALRRTSAYAVVAGLRRAWPPPARGPPSQT